MENVFVLAIYNSGILVLYGDNPTLIENIKNLKSLL